MKPVFLTVLAVMLTVHLVQAQGRRGSAGPNVGEKAPEVKLTLLDDDKKYDLAENFGKRPTVLVFGSYT